MPYIALLDNLRELILNLIDVCGYLNCSSITVFRRHLFFDFRTHYLATYGKHSSFPLNRDDESEVIGLVQVIREHFSTLTHPFLLQLQVKLLMNEARTITFLLVLQNFGVLWNASRMNSIEKVNEDLGSVGLLVENELVHEIKPLKQCLSQVVSVVSRRWIRP